MNNQKLPLLFGRGRIGGIDFEQQISNKTKSFQSSIKRYETDENGNIKRKIYHQSKFNRKHKNNSGHSHMTLGKYIHWSQKKEKEMTERDWRIFREDHNIIIKGGRVPKPLRYWDSYKIPEKIMSGIRYMGFRKPTPIQMQAIPIGMMKRDLIGIAPTGSGKSVAFLIPLIIHLQTCKPLDPLTSRDGPYGVIIAPARELILQIQEEFDFLAKNTVYRSQAIVGGRSIDNQAFKLKSGAEVIIATPGRLRDLLQNGYLVLNQCNWLIIDEADKMVELGFEEDLRYILNEMPQILPILNDQNNTDQQEKDVTQGKQKFRITHMFSATMDLEIEKLARKYLRNNVYVSIGEPGSGVKAITQTTLFIQPSSKKKMLFKYLDQTQPPIIIFMSQKVGVELITKNLQKRGYLAIAYHGGKSQEKREKAVDNFKDGKVDILVCTDLGGRGLDVKGVQHVINFDAPRNISTYVHRIGRTGRAGQKGLATTFITKEDENLFHDLFEFLKRNNQKIPEMLENHPMTKVKQGRVIPKNKPRSQQKLFAQ